MLAGQERGISRSIHTAYHFAAGLPGAELDRIPNKEQLRSVAPLAFMLRT